MRRTPISAILLLCVCAVAFGFEAEEYEEPAGSSLAILVSPEGGVYGVAMGQGTWLKGTPVFGGFNLSLFKNDIESALFSGVEMTLRIMPHWRIAPFAGAGGSFNYALSSSQPQEVSGIPAEAVLQREASGVPSYWGGHAEAGVRILLEGSQFIEALGRYTWSSTGSEAAYWLVGISLGGSL